MEWTLGQSLVNGELYDQGEACGRQSETKWASSVSLPGCVSSRCGVNASEDICAALLQIRLPLLRFYSQKHIKVITGAIVIIPCGKYETKTLCLQFILFVCLGPGAYTRRKQLFPFMQEELLKIIVRL